VHASKPSRAAKRALTVLIADDNPDVVATLSALLTHEGHVVHTCTNGTQSLEMIKRVKPAVCILDIVMPGLNGFDIAREIHALQLAQRPVLVAISGQYMNASDVFLARAAGFDHFFPKTADPRELLGLLAIVAGGQEPSAV
jgi:CheY-like chemotaxis protein